ncbi:MAG: hypothetical protein SFW67_00310 [Myxococcaceae bacterium]|nr:hypothetical protein [Myxococcaceae bacterium]
MLPLGAVSSHTFRGHDDAGRTAVLREVPEGQAPVVSTSVFPGIVPLREVTVIDGRRYGVWDFVEAESLQDACERLADGGRTVPLAVLARVVVDASRALVSVTPGRPHGGLSDASLLVRADGVVQVMDFGAPRPSRFTPRGPPSFGNDVFALGAVLHGALTGFGGSYADAVEEGLSLPAPSQLHDDCTPAIDDVIQRAISRTAETRQPDLELLADELEAVLGEALATRAQVAEALHGLGRSAPPMPDDDPGPALGAEEDAPTGRHELPGARETVQGLKPVPHPDRPESAPRTRIPMGTQPGGPTRDVSPDGDASASKPPAGVPMGTQPGGPAPTSRPPTNAGVPAREANPTSRPPTGAQPAVPAREATQSTKPSAGIPMGTQPGAPPRDAFAAVAEPAPRPSGVPMSTQPGVPSPALGDAPPDATQPRAVIPRAMTSRPSKPVAPAPVPVDTQPRLRLPVPDTSENEVPSGATPTPGPGPAPVSTAMSHAKLEWAATQTRVPTPPVGVPALGGDEEPEPTNAKARAPRPRDEASALGDEAEPEPTNAKARAPRPPDEAPALGDEDEPASTNVKARVPATSGTAPVLESVPSLESPAASAPEVAPVPGRGRRAVIAVLLVVVAGLFGAFAWKKQSAAEVVVEQVVIGDDAADAGASAQVPLPDEDAGSPNAGPDALADADAGADEEEDDVDGGDDVLEPESDAGAELDSDDAGASDAGTADAGAKKPTKKKPVKKKRRR